MSRLKGWATNSAKQPSILRTSLLTEECPFFVGPTAHAGSPNKHRKVSDCKAKAPLMGEYYVRRAYQRTVARHISIFR